MYDKCDKCGREILKKSMKRHKKTVCDKLPANWLEIVKSGKYSVGQLASKFGMSRSGMDRHINACGFAHLFPKYRFVSCSVCNRTIASNRIKIHQDLFCKKLPSDWYDEMCQEGYSLRLAADIFEVYSGTLKTHIEELGLDMPEVCQDIDRKPNNDGVCQYCEILTYEPTSKEPHDPTQTKLGYSCIYCFNHYSEDYRLRAIL